MFDPWKLVGSQRTFSLFRRPNMPFWPREPPTGMVTVIPTIPNVWFPWRTRAVFSVTPNLTSFFQDASPLHRGGGTTWGLSGGGWVPGLLPPPRSTPDPRWVSVSWSKLDPLPPPSEANKKLAPNSVRWTLWAPVACNSSSTSWS